MQLEFATRTQAECRRRYPSACRLGLILAARPGLLECMPLGDSAFGRIDGGHGLDGQDLLEIKTNELRNIYT